MDEKFGEAKSDLYHAESHDTRRSQGNHKKSGKWDINMIEGINKYLLLLLPLHHKKKGVFYGVHQVHLVKCSVVARGPESSL